MSCGLTSLTVRGKSLGLTVGNKVVKILLDGDATKVWIDGVLFSRRDSVEKQVQYIRVKYTLEHFSEVNQLAIERHYSQEAAIQKVAEDHGFVIENFRRQYYDRGGNKVQTEKKQ
jgi:hypothetical protein